MEKKSVREAWSASGTYWAKNANVISALFAPLTKALFDAVDLAQGERLLDLACGTGDVSVEARNRGASVVSADISPAMASAVLRRLGDGEHSSVVLADGAMLPFAPNSFDVVLSRLGVMFFPEPLVASKGVLRTLSPGGRAAFVVWGDRTRNPFFTIPSDAMGRYVPSEPDPPDAPGAWRYEEPGKLASIVEQAGARNVRDDELEFLAEAPLSFDDFWEIRVQMSDTLRDKSASLDAATRERLREEVRRGWEPYFASGTARFPSVARVVSFTSN